MNPNTILELILLFLIGLFVAFNYWNSRSKTPAIPYEHLRSQAFAVRAPGNSFNGVVMEIGFPGAFATLIAYENGDASLYLSTGDCVAADRHSLLIREAAVNFVHEAQKHIKMLHRVTTYPLPQKGAVRFFILTPGGVYSAEVPEKQLQESASILTDLYKYGHYVIYQLGKLKREKELFS